MATKLTCDFCGVEIFDSSDPIRPTEQTKCTVSIYRDGTDTEMLDRDACASCANKAAIILARSDGNLLQHFVGLVDGLKARAEANRSTSL